MTRISAILGKTVSLLKGIGACCLVAMMLLTCVDVVGRFFNHPIFGSVEIVGFLATLAVAVALPYTHQVKGHIGVEILVRLFPERVQLVFELITDLLALVLMGIITWRMTIYAGTMKASGEVSMNLEFPEYLIIYATAFCFLVFWLVIFEDLLTCIKRLKGDK